MYFSRKKARFIPVTAPDPAKYDFILTGIFSVRRTETQGGTSAFSDRP